MNLTLPWRRVRVTAIACRYCHQWHKPRHLSLPAVICRSCEAQGRNQTWHPRRDWGALDRKEQR